MKIFKNSIAPVIGGLTAAFLGCVGLQAAQGNLTTSTIGESAVSLDESDGVVIFTGVGPRIDVGIDMLLQGYTGDVLISGVQENNTLPNILDETGQPEAIWYCNSITLGGQGAQDTIGNAFETRQWVHDQGHTVITLVTTESHMPRAYFELRRMLPETVHIHMLAVNNNESPLQWAREVAKLGLRTVGATAQDLTGQSPDRGRHLSHPYRIKRMNGTSCDTIGQTP